MAHRTTSPVRGKADLVTVRHATPRRNLRSIFATGVRPDRAKGKLRAVWLHAPGRSAWARAHVARRHQVARGEVVVLVLRVPRAQLRRRGPGVWIYLEVIAPLRIIGVNALKVFAA